MTKDIINMTIPFRKIYCSEKLGKRKKLFLDTASVTWEGLFPFPHSENLNL